MDKKTWRIVYETGEEIELRRVRKPVRFAYAALPYEGCQFEIEEAPPAPARQRPMSHPHRMLPHDL